MPPIIGATQKSQSCASAQPPTKRAVAVLRAGLTDRLVTGMPTRWMSVRPRPMETGAKPCGARREVEPMMIMRNMNVRMISETRPAANE